MAKILVIEDDRNIADIVEYNLITEGFEVLRAEDGNTGLDLALHGGADLILLDVMLPGMDGFTLIRAIREKNSRTNFILLADHQEYVMQALKMKLRLSGVILDQPDVQTVGDQLCNLWYPLDSAVYG